MTTIRQAFPRRGIRPLGRALLAAVLAAGVLVPAHATAGTGPEVPATPAGEAPIACPDALFKIMPGAFNYCVARKDWQRGRYQAGLGMLRRAAAWGVKDAQLVLGLAYFNGEHVPADRPLGLAWLGLAAERQELRPVQLLASAYGKASPDERQRAQRLLDTMWATYGDPHAAVRADKRYQRAIRDLAERDMYGDGICMDGITSTPIAGMNPKDPIGCPPISNVVKMFDSIYANTMHGWSGSVSVGALQREDPPND